MVESTILSSNTQRRLEAHCWCAMGRVEEAREMLESAFNKDKSLRDPAETN
jgi:hypothetical protein